MNKADLSAHLKLFASLKRAPGPVWTESTKHKAPHKPLLLLAVLDLVHRGVITAPFIVVTGDLVELYELFNLYWRRIIPLGQSSSSTFPLSRLDREPFWKLVPQPGKSISPAIINNTSSITYLRKYALGAHMDEGLFRIKKVSKKVRIVSQPRTNRLCVSAKSSVATKLRGALTDELTMSATV